MARLVSSGAAARSFEYGIPIECFWGGSQRTALFLRPGPNAHFGWAGIPGWTGASSFYSTWAFVARHMRPQDAVCVGIYDEDNPNMLREDIELLETGLAARL